MTSREHILNNPDLTPEGKMAFLMLHTAEVLKQSASKSGTAALASFKDADIRWKSMRANNGDGRDTLLPKLLPVEAGATVRQLAALEQAALLYAVARENKPDTSRWNEISEANLALGAMAADLETAAYDIAKQFSLVNGLEATPPATLNAMRQSLEPHQVNVKQARTRLIAGLSAAISGDGELAYKVSGIFEQFNDRLSEAFAPVSPSYINQAHEMNNRKPGRDIFTAMSLQTEAGRIFGREVVAPEIARLMALPAGSFQNSPDSLGDIRRLATYGKQNKNWHNPNRSIEDQFAAPVKLAAAARQFRAEEFRQRGDGAVNQVTREQARENLDEAIHLTAIPVNLTTNTRAR